MNNRQSVGHYNTETDKRYGKREGELISIDQRKNEELLIIMRLGKLYVTFFQPIRMSTY